MPVRVLLRFSVEHEESAGYYAGCGKEDTLEDGFVDDWLGRFSGFFRFCDGFVRRLDSERLRRWPVHDYVDPEDLHGVELKNGK